MITKEVIVTQLVRVTVDETKFTAEFLEAFPNAFYPFQDIDDHIKHIAQLDARGAIGFGDNAFIEGYGEKRNFGIKTQSSVEDVDFYDG